jgi:hypothetical protein
MSHTATGGIRTAGDRTIAHLFVLGSGVMWVGRGRVRAREALGDHFRVPSVPNAESTAYRHAVLSVFGPRQKKQKKRSTVPIF